MMTPIPSQPQPPGWLHKQPHDRGLASAFCLVCYAALANDQPPLPLLLARPLCHDTSRSRSLDHEFVLSSLASTGRAPVCHPSRLNLCSAGRTTRLQPPHVPRSNLSSNGNARLGAMSRQSCKSPSYGSSQPDHLPPNYRLSSHPICQPASHCSRGIKALSGPDSIAKVMPGATSRQCGAASGHKQECEATWLPFCGSR